MKTVVGVFPNAREAELTSDELVQHGFARNDISLVDKGDVEADDLVRQLTGYGVPDRTARLYVDGIRRGGTLETVRVEDDDVDEALSIMRKHTDGTSADRLGGGGTMTKDRIANDTDVGKDETISVVGEEFTVGKRALERGGVKVTTRVVEQPVEKDVQLREEHVRVERRPVNRDIDPDAADFRERTIEMIEHKEEPVVAKRARVIEEISLRKDVEERTEKVRDTVRKMEADVQPIAGKDRARGFDANDYRTHYDRFNTKSGYAFKDYEPAYKFGHEMRSDSRFAGGKWEDVEPKARTEWEKSNPNTWEHFKDSIRHAWDKLK